jgi:hypothetical protein
MTTTTKTKKRIRKAPPTFDELSPSQRAKINELAPSVRNKLTIQGPDNCWVHPMGVLGQTAHPDGVRQSLGKYVWAVFHPEDEPYTGAVGDPMTSSIRPRPECVDGCIRPDHLSKMSAAERSKKGRPEGATPYVGVVPHRQSGLFQARFHADNTMYSGGYFNTAEEAAVRYDSMASFYDPDRPTNYSMGLVKTKPKPAPENERKITSKHRGVFWFDNKNRWFARASIDGKQKHIGSFLTEEDAAVGYNNFVKEHDLGYPLNVID